MVKQKGGKVVRIVKLNKTRKDNLPGTAAKR
jgi:hypothetical protein